VKLAEYGTSPLNEREENSLTNPPEEDRIFKHLKNPSKRKTILQKE
jgi:hypothetical protein